MKEDNAMAIFDTNGQEVAAEHLKKAHKTVKELRDYLAEVDAAMAEHKGGAFNVTWSDGITDRALMILTEISRCNGAVLVRGTEPEKEVKTAA